jgi:serine protease AprX
MKRITSPGLAVLLSLSIFTLTAIPALAGITFIPGQGLVLTGADGLVLTGDQGLVLTGADGLLLAGGQGLVLTGADGLLLTGADALTYTSVEGLVLTGADSSGLQSLDPELAVLLDQLPDTSAINVFVIYHSMPTDSDLNDLSSVGVLGGTRFRNLPMIIINATKGQIATISTFPSVRSLYSNKTLEFLTHDTRVITGQNKVATDSALTAHNNGLPVSGKGVTVAVLDTGIDGTHPDLVYGGHLIDNVRLADLQGSAPAFIYPEVVGGLANTDLVMGHGTFVANVLAGSGAASGGYYGGMAPGASVMGLAAGDVSLFFVLSGIDYILSHRVDRNIRVVNCSFGISGLFDVNDPVNIATKIMHDSGIAVVFSAGNRGDQPNSLNPYSVADWVIGVGSGTKDRKLSSFSSRGAAGYGAYHPTLIAPGENVVSARAAGINVVGTADLAGALVSAQNDLNNIPLLYLPKYTMSSGTSFSAPHVSGTIALMLEAAPQLTPDQIKQILQETASPMLGYSRYEVGAGYLNTYAAVRKAALSDPYGAFRANLSQGVSYSRDALIQFYGQSALGSSFTTTVTFPNDTTFATVLVSWMNTVAPLNNLSVTLSRSGQTVTSKPSAFLAGQGVQRTGVTLNAPQPGTWVVTVQNTGVGAKSFNGAIETVHANYTGLSDIAQMPTADQQTIKRAVQCGLITTLSGNFAGGASATRLDVARALMLGAGALIPQYLPASPTFADVPADSNAVFIESVTNAPQGNIMGITGSHFNPQASVDRLTMAIAVVKALGLDSLAQNSNLINPGIADWYMMPLSSRGYVAVAVSRNLMSVGSAGTFRPFDQITRTELSCTATALQKAAR